MRSRGALLFLATSHQKLTSVQAPREACLAEGADYLEQRPQEPPLPCNAGPTPLICHVQAPRGQGAHLQTDRCSMWDPLRGEVSSSTHLQAPFWGQTRGFSQAHVCPEADGALRSAGLPLATLSLPNQTKAPAERVSGECMLPRSRAVVGVALPLLEGTGPP